MRDKIDALFQEQELYNLRDLQKMCFPNKIRYTNQNLSKPICSVDDLSVQFKFLKKFFYNLESAMKNLPDDLQMLEDKSVGYCYPDDDSIVSYQKKKVVP